MKETVLTIAKWHEETFPDATLRDQLLKFEEEKKEFSESKDIMELADMFIVACGVCRFDCLAAAECFDYIPDLLANFGGTGACALFQSCIDKKMEINRKRTWEKTPCGNYHHTNIED